jgi:hypothetical protein
LSLRVFLTDQVAVARSAELEVLVASAVEVARAAQVVAAELEVLEGVEEEAATLPAAAAVAV